MAKRADEELLEKLLENQHRVGVIGTVDKMTILEEFWAARAQRKASTYALYATIAAAISVVVAVASLAVSISK